MPVGAILSVLAELVECAHCGWCHSLAGTLLCLSGERELGSLRSSLCFLVVDTMYPAASSSYASTSLL